MKSLFRSLSAATLALAVVAPQALAQDAYPTRPIRIVVPYPAGSALESVARTVSQTYNDNLGQPAVIMNKPGGSGIIGTQEVARAQPTVIRCCWAPTRRMARTRRSIPTCRTTRWAISRPSPGWRACSTCWWCARTWAWTACAG